MKSNKKMSVNRSIKQKRLSARVPSLVYLRAKFVAESQGMTMEEKVTDLLKKDILYVSSQKWFQELLSDQGEDGGDFELFSAGSGKKNQKGKPMTETIAPSDDQFGEWNKN